MEHNSNQQYQSIGNVPGCYRCESNLDLPITLHSLTCLASVASKDDCLSNQNHKIERTHMEQFERDLCPAVMTGTTKNTVPVWTANFTNNTAHIHVPHSVHKAGHFTSHPKLITMSQTENNIITKKKQTE